MNTIDRRTFLASTAAAVPAGLATSTLAAPAVAARPPSGKPVLVASGNGLNAANKAAAMINQGVDPLVAIVEGITLVENDPRDHSVGYGGLPNEDGVVQLDAAVMHGPTHKAGAVAAIEGIRNPAKVALKVMERTDHVLLVGAGATEFAKAHGFPVEDLLTDKARAIWLRWREDLNPNDDWLDEDQHVGDLTPPEEVGFEMGRPSRPALDHGTVHMSGVDGNGNVAACTSTSGLSFKIPGRVGDSPIIGAGLYADNEVGTAGATGRGESLIQSCGAFQIVQHMAHGDEPEAACLKVLEWIARHTKRPSLLNERGHPNFGATVYAVRKDGLFGSATMRRGGGKAFVVHDGVASRLEKCAWLYE